MKRLLRPDEVAEILNISKKTVYRLCGCGDLVCLPVGKGGRTLRVIPSSVNEYIQRQTKKYILSEGILKNDDPR